MDAPEGPVGQRVSRRGSRGDVGNRRVGTCLKRDFFPGRLIRDQGSEQLVVERVTRLVAAELANQAVSEKIKIVVFSR